MARAARLVVVGAVMAAAAAVSACGAEDPPLAGQYDDPGDFSNRSACTPGTLAGAPAAGVWNVNVVTPSLWFPTAIRIDDEGGGVLRARAFGNDGAVTSSDDDLFVRVAYDTSGGDQRLFVVDLCGELGDSFGSLAGYAVYCRQGVCETGSVTGQRLAAIAGEQEADGLVEVGEWTHPAGEGVALNVRVVDHVAYLVVRAGLHIIDVHDPAHPAPIGFSPVPDPPATYNDVKLVRAGERRYALCASDELGVIVVDVTDPGAPAEVTRFGIGVANVYGVHTVFVDGSGGHARAYLANDVTGGVDVWNVGDPEAPSLLGQYIDPVAGQDRFRFVHDLYAEDGIAYLNYWDGGLEVVDLTAPGAPHVVGHFSGYPWATSHSNWVTTTSGGRRISVHGDEGYYAHTRLIDVDPASPAFMTEIGAFELRPWVSVHNIMAFGDRAYVTHYQDGFRILDISDPTQPTQIAYFHTWTPEAALGESLYEGAIGVDVDLDAGLYYLADTERGLIIVRDE